jgi:hypothetical protein
MSIALVPIEPVDPSRAIFLRFMAYGFHGPGFIPGEKISS